MRAIDVSDPMHPLHVGGSETAFLEGVALANGLVYVAEPSGLRVIDFGPE